MLDTQPPAYCQHCGAALPSAEANFCIECGRPVADGVPDDTGAPVSSAGVPTVRLSNAQVEQTVVGGTVKLPSSGAFPPGIWQLAEPPGPDDIVAIYAPLRAIVGGWSGLSGAGWQPDAAAPALARGTAMLFRFVCEREWFARPGGAGGLRLRARIQAEAEAAEGHARRGFRYRVAHDPPMQIVAARWIDLAGRERRDLPLPQIQLMAPPRIPRVSDFAEAIRVLPAPEAHVWAQRGAERGVFRLLHTAQQRTPAGRGLPLVGEGLGARLSRLFGRGETRYRVQLQRPLVCRWPEWPEWISQMRAAGRDLGLDFEADSVIEWWLDRQGHDGVIFESAQRLYGHDRAVIAFRRSQIARIEGT